MSDEKKYYCFCGSNCKYETMTKEQILSAIAQAVEGGAVVNPNAGFITKVKETNGGGYVTFWVGKQSQYNAIEKKDASCLYIITDDTSAEDLERAIKKLKETEERLNQSNTQISEALKKEQAKAIESTEHPGCYYRVVAGKTEWINPPLIPNVEYRTTKRANGLAEYVKLVQVLPRSIPDTGDYLIPHNIAGLNLVTKVFATYGKNKLLPWFDFNYDNFSLIAQVDTSHIYLRNKKAVWDDSSGVINIVVHYTKGD